MEEDANDHQTSESVLDRYLTLVRESQEFLDNKWN